MDAQEVNSVEEDENESSEKETEVKVEDSSVLGK